MLSISNSHPLEEIDIQLKNRLDRKRSIDTTSGGSNVTVIEGNLAEEEVVDDKIYESIEKTELNCNDLVAQATPTLPSCLFRHDSVRASIKKKVRCSEATEVIPPPDYFVNDDWHEVSHEDDDDVFSDSAPIQTPRGNMCTPYIERKGSLPGLEALPGWFPNSRWLLVPLKKILFLIFQIQFCFSYYSSRKCSIILYCSNMFWISFGNGLCFSFYP